MTQQENIDALIKAAIAIGTHTAIKMVDIAIENCPGFVDGPTALKMLKDSMQESLR